MNMEFYLEDVNLQQNSQEESHVNLVYKLNNSNDFTISFAIQDLAEFTHQYGFNKALEVAKEMTNKQYQLRALHLLYKYAKNHCTRWENSYDELLEFFLGRVE